MSKALALLGIAAALGTGYIIGKKLMQNNPEAVAAVKSSCEEKLHKASVVCAGAVKTGSEKISESVEKIVSASKEKGEAMSKKVQTTGNSFKNEINELKNRVVSYSSGAEVDISEDEDYANAFTFEEEEEPKELTEMPEIDSEAL